ncbi:MAG: aspartate aminotransferase family protein [Phycisphaerales bacterium]
MTSASPVHQAMNLREQPAITAAIDALVRQVAEASRSIKDVCPPDPALADAYQRLTDRAAAVKGRGLLFPYIGSGLGNGPLVQLADGSVKWDMICGIGVHFFGHSHPEMIRAAALGSLEDTHKHGNLQSGFDAFKFGEKLVELASRTSRLKHAFMTTSGAMANESALKICYQKHAPASRVIAFADCFMGRSVTMSQIGDSASNRQGIPLSTLVDYMPFYDEVEADRVGGPNALIDRACRQLEQYINRYPGQHACFIFELVQGEGGFNVANRDFFKALMEICRDRGIAVWDDEIQSFGRTERLFAYDMYDLGEYIDVLCVGKLTQACATLFTEQYNPKPGLLSGTFTGTTSDFTTGLRVLELLDDPNNYGPDGAFARHHRLFREHASALIARRPEWFPSHPSVRDPVGGVGGMMRFTPFGGDKEKVTKACRACFDEGVVLFYCGHGPYHIRLLPPLPVMKDEYWPRVFECIERGLARVAG